MISISLSLSGSSPPWYWREAMFATLILVVEDSVPKDSGIHVFVTELRSVFSSQFFFKSFSLNGQNRKMGKNTYNKWRHLLNPDILLLRTIYSSSFSELWILLNITYNAAAKDGGQKRKRRSTFFQPGQRGRFVQCSCAVPRIPYTSYPLNALYIWVCRTTGIMIPANATRGADGIADVKDYWASDCTDLTLYFSISTMLLISMHSGWWNASQSCRFDGLSYWKWID